MAGCELCIIRGKTVIVQFQSRLSDANGIDRNLKTLIKDIKDVKEQSETFLSNIVAQEKAKNTAASEASLNGDDGIDEDESDDDTSSDDDQPAIKRLRAS